jgi:hypothetical protein
MKKRLLTLGALSAFLLLGNSLIASASVEPLFHENPTQLPDLREKYDQLCGNNTSAQTLNLADLDADGKLDILVTFWCGVPPGTVKTGLPTEGGMVAFLQTANGTFIDDTRAIFGSDLPEIEKTFENVVYDFNSDGYDDIFMTMSREDGRFDPWDAKDNILNAVVMSNGDGSYSLLRTGCIQPCGTGYNSHALHNEVGGIDVATQPIGYGGAKEVWRFNKTWERLEILEGGGGLVFLPRQQPNGASLNYITTAGVQDDGFDGLKLFARDSYEGSWSGVHQWQKPTNSTIQTTWTGWNGDQSKIDIHVIDGSYYVGGLIFEYGCDIQRDPSGSVDLVYLQTGYRLDSYEEGMAIQESIGMKWVYNLVAFSVKEDRLMNVPIQLTGNPDPDDKTHRIACEDVNSDGLVDIVVATWDPEAYPHVYLNQGNDNFSLVNDDLWPRMTESHSGNIYADVNKDGIHDIVYFPGPNVRTSATSEIRYDIHYGKRVISTQDTYDSDSDGFLNNLDAFPNDSAESVDTDADGVGNNADTDDDGDGVSDAQENILGTDQLISDSDTDGYSDGDEVDSGTDPLDADDVPEIGLNWFIIRSILDANEASSQASE